MAKSLQGLAILFLLATSAMMGQSSRKPLPTITTAAGAHDLTLEAAARAYPVRLRAVVTYYDPYIDTRHPALFVHDSTGAIFIVLPSAPRVPLLPGDLIEITGVTATGDFAPIVGNAAVRVIGHSHLPSEAPRVSLTALLAGKHDGQWVELEGVVHAVKEFGGNVTLDVTTADGSLGATSVREDGADYRRLIDATVRIHGNVAPVFNRYLQLTGARLFFPRISQIQIEEPALADPFHLPVLPVNRLLRFTPKVAFVHRVHVQGRVSLQWPGRSLCIQGQTGGLCVRTSESTLLKEGELADVIGFPAIDGLNPTLTQATFRSAGPSQKITTTPVTAEQALRGDFDTELVRIEGTVIGRDLAAKDPTMVLSSGKSLFQVVLPDRAWGKPIPAWAEDSVLSVTGICSVQLSTKETLREGLSVPSSFRILLRSPDDVAVLHGPPWWTADHILPLLAAVLAITLCVLGWVAVLRHRIAEQTAVIQQQNATLKDLSFQDSLTGIANRRKFDETLEAEFERATRTSTPLSLLILDIDHFKSLNDRYGHQCGDECLVRVANTLVSTSLRTADLVARYGGEEFAVILPGCEEAGAIALAESMRIAVLNLAITNVNSPFNQSLSISVGAATILPGSGESAAALVGMADAALYQAKLYGRNRTCTTPTLTTKQTR